MVQTIEKVKPSEQPLALLRRFFEVRGGFEPPYTVLQTGA
jgi:hypothetical protein